MSRGPGLKPFARAGVRPLAVLALAAAAVAPVRGDEAPTEYYSFDLVLAPACLDGDFVVTVTGDAGPWTAQLRAATDVRGRVTGTLTQDVRVFQVTGSVTSGKKGVHVALTATAGKDRLTFSGAVAEGVASGTVTGKGAVLPGKHAFSIDVGAAGPLTAHVEAAVATSAKGRFSGSAVLTACGEQVDLTIGGSRGKRSSTLTLKAGKSFRFTGRGAADDDLVLDWTAKGFGAHADGDDVALDPLSAPAAPAFGFSFLEVETDDPIVPFAPSTGGGPATFSIAPALPAGLSFDVRTAGVSGTPTEIRDSATYTVTATNLAGTASGSFQLRSRIARWRSFDVETRTLSDDDLRHFLVRTQFGATQPAMDRLRANGLESEVAAMLVFAQNGPAEAVAAPELANASDPAGYEGRFPSATQLARWWSSLMMATDNPFQERLAFFWHDHFAAATDVLDTSENHFMQDYVNLFRRRGQGNLRTLLVDMARDPCMLKYLDGYRNSRTRPNENFAREFWELFTLGVDNGYTQDDIVEAARAFTGWKRTTVNVPLAAGGTTPYATMTFDPALHDTGSKTFLGQTVLGQAATDDYQRVVDLTLDHRPVAEFIVKKLFEHFAYADPPQSLVKDMADELRAQGYELAPFLSRLFRSEAFFSSRARRSLVKNPVDFAMGFMQTTGLRITTSSLQTSLSRLGQVPTQPPTVNGWPLGELWLSS